MVYLREVKTEDKYRLFEITSNDKVTEFLTWNPHKNIKETEYVINNFFIHNNESRPNSFAIINKEDNILVGVIDFLPGRINTEVFEIGFFLDPVYWNKGIMTKALNLIIEIGFNKYKYNKIGISHNINNIGSEKVIIKNKFKFIKEVESIVKGVNVTQKYYEIKKDDFYEKKS